MPSINITKEEFADIALALLLDKIMAPEEIIPDERFDEIIDLMERRGLKPHLLHYYMGSQSKTRSKWKQLKKSLIVGKTPSASINIRTGDEEPEDTEQTKGVIKKVISLIKAHRKKSGFPLNEQKIDKIIEKVLIEEGIIEEKECDSKIL